MHAGIALRSPDGMGCFDSHTTYHLLANRTDSVLLASFSKHPREWRAHIIRVDRDEFEQALIKKDIVPLAQQPTLPPWLKMLEGLNLDGLDDGRVSAKKSYRNWAQDRFEKIHALVSTPDSFFDGDPTKAIATFAAKQKQNRHRIQLWFCAYVCFGQSLMALAPPFANVGRWDRSNGSMTKVKFGRKSKSGAGRGHSAIPLTADIESSYLKYAGLGISMTQIHRKALIHAFGCLTRTDEKGIERYYHPENKPFPSYQQYRYHVVKAFGLPVVRRAKIGDEKYRNRVADNVGRYSENLANLYERTESDCAHVNERPRMLLSNEAGPPLIVAREVDVLSSAVIGIGFAYGSEKSEAYRAAKFCAAVPKSYFCSLFGIDISDDDWPCEGLPPASTTDRGPGASSRVFSTEENTPPIRDLAPSHSGQSKATVESSHPRETQTAGAPSYVVSSLNAFQLARREIYRTLADNHAKDVTSRITPEMLAAAIAPSPVGIFKFMDERGRTSAVPMSVEAAVREFLTPVKFKLNRDGLWLRSLRYDLKKLQSLGLTSLAGRNVTLEVTGYALPLAIRVAWIEVNGRIHEIEALLPIRDDTSQLDMTLSDLSQLDEKMRELRSTQAEHARAIRGKYEVRHQEETGEKWDESTRKGGKAPSRKSTRGALDDVSTPTSERAA